METGNLREHGTGAEPEGTPVVGQVFTPVVWARFAVQRSDLVASWLKGKTILDPALGTGNLFIALVEEALEKGWSLQELPFGNLFGVEIDPVARGEAVERFRAFGVDLSTNFHRGDLFEQRNLGCDIVFSNPPWLNFADLPAALKPIYKTRFLASGLVPDSSKLLLGRSRIDLAALFVVKTIREYLAGSEAWFFLPLSLFLNDGAHTAFRTFHIDGVRFAPETVYDFGREPVFPGIATRCCLVKIAKGKVPHFPVPYFQLSGTDWSALEARPLFEPAAPWSVGISGTLSEPRKISMAKPSMPRQGLNTGGANAIFVFDRMEFSGDFCRAGNDRLPAAFVYPLLTARQFRNPDEPPSRWVLLPYRSSGKPLSPTELESEPELKEYLEHHRTALAGRRGVLLGTVIKRGLWWAMLGVGAYSFAPYKVVWEALGKSQFRPSLWPGQWQVNQALQSYLPFWSEDAAKEALQRLQEPEVAAYLASMQMAGTMNWAQPGRIRRLLEVSDS